MATKNTKSAEPEVEYDFDGWTEENEQAAIESLRPEVKYIIVEKTFIGRFPDGVVVKMPLTLSVDDVDELEALGVGPVDQLKHLLTKIGGKRTADEFTRHDISAATALATKYFMIFQKIAQATFPE